jgi:hypothetical protein
MRFLPFSEKILIGLLLAKYLPQIGGHLLLLVILSFLTLATFLYTMIWINGILDYVAMIKIHKGWCWCFVGTTAFRDYHIY